MIASYTSAGNVGGNSASTFSSEMKRVSVLRNETLSSVLNRIGARAKKPTARSMLRASCSICAACVRVTMSRPGWRRTTDGAMRLVGVSLRPEADRQILVSRAVDGSWSSHELMAKLSPGINYIAADVDQSIYQTATALGAGDQQVVDFADIFGYDIDFQREVRTGDRFGMLYETFEDERGQPVKTGVVLMAAMDGAGTHQDVLPLHAVGRWRRSTISTRTARARRNS